MHNVPILNIITPCVRCHNLATIYRSINPYLFRINWFIVADGDFYIRPSNEMIAGSSLISVISLAAKSIPSKDGSKKNYGIAQRNFALDKVRDGYVYFLDDDNIMHNDFFTVYQSISPTGKAFTVNQKRFEHGEWELKGNNPTPCNIDTAMFCLPVSMIGSSRWEPDIDHHDGVFINKIWEANKDRFVFVNHVASYFNYLNRS